MSVLVTVIAGQQKARDQRDWEKGHAWSRVHIRIRQTQPLHSSFDALVARRWDLLFPQRHPSDAGVAFARDVIWRWVGRAT